MAHRIGVAATAATGLCVLFSAAGPTLAFAVAQTFHTRVDVVQLNVSVFDRGGNPVDGLGVDDFVVRDRGESRRVLSVVPVTVIHAPRRVCQR